MGEAFIVRRGGRTLDFAVKVYATKDELLADAPNKVTIGVVTTTAVSEVSIQASPPSNPASGKVWIADTASKWQAPFHRTTLRKSGPSIDMEIYPCFCKQYISGAWKLLDAYIYQSGAWTQFSTESLMLYEDGTDNTSVTGGWTITTKNGSTVTFDSSYIALNGGAGFQCSATTKNLINTSGFTRLGVTYTLPTCRSNNDDAIEFGFCEGADLFPDLTVGYISTKPTVVTNETTVYVDLSSAINKYLILAFRWVGELRIHKVWLE